MRKRLGAHLWGIIDGWMDGGLMDGEWWMVDDGGGVRVTGSVKKHVFWKHLKNE